MNKYDKMLALNKEASKKKVELARKAILEMMDDNVKVTVPKLMKKTGLSQGFFYKNPTIRALLDQTFEQQAGMPDLRRGALDIAMNNEIVLLHERIRGLERENADLKSENQRLRKAMERKNANILRSL